MSELISGKEALIALANGEHVEFSFDDDNFWRSLNYSNVHIKCVLNDSYKFRLKPCTITINGLGVAKPTYMEWDKDKDPNSVTITFNSESEAKKAHESLGKIMFNAP